MDKADDYRILKMKSSFLLEKSTWNSTLGLNTMLDLVMKFEQKRLTDS